MAWHGSPTAVTGWPRPWAASGPEKRPRSSPACAAEVSWYSSSSTTPNSCRKADPTEGTSVASRAAQAIWSANSTRPKRCFRFSYASTRRANSRRSAAAARAPCRLAYISPRGVVGAPSSSARNSAACPFRSAGSTRCDRNSAESSRTRCVIVSGRSRDRCCQGPGASATTRAARRNRAAPVIMRHPSSMPRSSPCSDTSRPAKAS